MKLIVSAILAIGLLTCTAKAVCKDPAALVLAKLAYSEARGCTEEDQRAVMWTAINRTYADGYGMGGTLLEVVTFPGQFTGYRISNPTTDDLYAIALDVLDLWRQELSGEMIDRTLPREYLWFSGNGKRNCFRDSYIGGNELTFE